MAFKSMENPFKLKTELVVNCKRKDSPKCTRKTNICITMEQNGTNDEERRREVFW